MLGFQQLNQYAPEFPPFVRLERMTQTAPGFAVKNGETVVAPSACVTK